jgi:hypothetical protein
LLILGSVVQGNNMMSPPTQQPITTAGGQQIKSDVLTRPIVGGTMQANALLESLGDQSQQRRQLPPPSPNLPRSMPAAPVSTAPAYGVPITGRVHTVAQPTAQPQVRPGMGVNPTAANPLLMQRMVHPAALNATANRGKRIKH